MYSTPTRLLAVIAWAFCLFFAVNLILTGTGTSIWHFLPWLLIVAWGLFLFLWRPRLEIGPEGLTVVNILREHTIPFAALTAFRVAQNVSFDTTAGRIASWGAPGAGKLGPRIGSAPRKSSESPGGRTSITIPVAQEQIQSTWDVWERTQEDQVREGLSVSPPVPPREVTSRWNRRAVVVSVVLSIVAVASALS
ncbi:PH domain-containing protein [Arthrobacter sp. TMN-49]